MRLTTISGVTVEAGLVIVIEAMSLVTHPYFNGDGPTECECVVQAGVDVLDIPGAHRIRARGAQ